MQDGLSSLTGLSLLSFDQNRAPACEPSQDNPICTLIRLSRTGQAHCSAHCGKALADAQRTGETQFLKCEANLHVFTVPIVVGDKVTLLVQGGKRFITEEERMPTDRVTDQTGLPQETFRALATNQSPVQQDRLPAVATYLEQAGRFLFESERLRSSVGTKFSTLFALFNLVGELQQEVDLENVYVTLLSSIGILFGVNTVAFLAVDAADDMVALKQAFGYHTEALRGYRHSLHDGLLARVIRERRHRRTTEALEIAKLGLPGSVRSVDLVPMVIPDGQVASLILILDSELAPEDVQALEGFGALAAVILHNRLLRHRLEEGARHFAALARFAHELGSTLDTDRLLDLILDRSVALVDAEKGSLMLVDDEEGSLAIRAAKGLNKRLVDSVRVAPYQGISGKVLATGNSLLVSDLERDERVSQKQNPRYRTKSFISIPLKPSHRTIGVLNISDKMNGDEFSHEDLERLASIADYASVAIERSAFYHKAEELKRTATVDELTGLVNRRHFEVRLIEEVNRSRRYRLPLALLMVDLDNFVHINQGIGRAGGDQVLRAAARVIRQAIRTIDLVARYSAGAFAILLPITTKPGAAVIGERLCSELRRLDLPVQPANKPLAITASVGVACYPEDADSLDGLIQQAETALQAAKQRGKDQVVVFRRP